MRSTLILLLCAGLVEAQRHIPVRENTQELLNGLTVASFIGTPEDSIQAVARDSSGNILVTGTTYSPAFPVKDAEQPAFGEATILETTNLGATWTKVGSPPGGATAVAPDPVMAGVLFAANASGVYKSSDSGQTWRLSYAGAASAPVINPGNHLQLVAVASGKVIRSLDGGMTWAAGAACPTVGCGELLADPTGSGALLAISFQMQISRDWGLTFASFGPASGVGFPMVAAFDPSNPGWIYVDKAVGVIGTLFLTTNYGATWTQKASPVTGQGFSFIMSMAVDPNQPNVLVAASPGGVYASSDGAASWTLESSLAFAGDTNGPFIFAPGTCGAGLFAIGVAIPGSFSVAFSSNLGMTWAPQLSHVISIAAGANCAFYAVRTATSDAFLAKIAPSGAVLWATYLGGSDQDAPVALSVDSQGNAYVAGNTRSADFPATVAHIGAAGVESAFVAKFAPNGALLYSATIGGEAVNTAVGLAVDANQNVYLAGNTDSFEFPVTAGTLGVNLSAGSYTGYLVKLSSSAGLAYATYLGPSYTEVSTILVDSSGEVTIAGEGPPPGTPSGQTGANQYVVKLNASASQVVQAAVLPATLAANGLSIGSMAADSQNNLILFGETSGQATPGAFFFPQPALCENPNILGASDAYVMKLAAANWRPVYTAVFGASCGMETGAMAIDSSGAVVLALGATSDAALSSPVLGGPVCSQFSSEIMKLSADGSTLEFATFLPRCGVPGLALAPDGSAYVGVSPAPSENSTAVLHLGMSSSAPIALNGIANAFSGDASGVAPGGLYSLAVSGFTPATVDLGLSPSANLPTELSGVEVTFDSVPAAILLTAPGQIIVAAPPVLPGYVARSGGVGTGAVGSPMYTAVQAIANGLASNVVLMPVVKIVPGLLTTNFPGAMPNAIYANSPDANARNADGTANSPSNPAAIGSTITLFATGLGATIPLAAPGMIATSAGVEPAAPLYSTWESSGPGTLAMPLVVSQVAGFISDVFQIEVPIPANVETRFGANLGNGVYRVEVGLQLGVPVAVVVPAASNLVSVYVK